MADCSGASIERRLARERENKGKGGSKKPDAPPTTGRDGGEGGEREGGGRRPAATLREPPLRS